MSVPACAKTDIVSPATNGKRSHQSRNGWTRLSVGARSADEKTKQDTSKLSERVQIAPGQALDHALRAKTIAERPAVAAGAHL